MRGYSGPVVDGSLEYSEERIEAFPTRIFRRKFEGLAAFNDRMRDIILEKEADFKKSQPKGVVRSNVGGWHSENDLFRWNVPELEVLLNLFQAVLVDYMALETERAADSFQLSAGLEGWANVVRRGNYAKAHVHPMSNIALVYYVDAGDHVHESKEDISGAIEFLDPRNRAYMFTAPGMDVRDSLLSRPESSVLLAFPSWLYHTVHPYQGNRPRISIAANATIKEFRPRAAPRGRPAATIIEE